MKSEISLTFLLPVSVTGFCLCLPNNQTCILGLKSSQRSRPNASPKLWTSSPGAARRLPAARQGVRLERRELIQLHIEMRAWDEMGSYPRMDRLFCSCLDFHFTGSRLNCPVSPQKSVLISSIGPVARLPEASIRTVARFTNTLQPLGQMEPKDPSVPVKIV